MRDLGTGLRPIEPETVSDNAKEIGGNGDVAQRMHERGVVEARLVMAGQGDELVTALIRREVALGREDDHRHHHAP